MNVFVPSKEVRIMGLQNIYTDEENKYFLPRYTTEFPTNEHDNSYLTKLASLDFNIIDVHKGIIKTTLPYHWTHFRINKQQELIVDEYGRTRLVIDTKNKTSMLVRRFDFGIELVEDSDKKQTHVKCFLTEQGRVISQIDIADEEYKTIIAQSNGSTEQLINLCSLECSKIIEENLPEWRDETKYWNDLN